MNNRENYEIWFVDFMEGNLDKTQLKALAQFLEKNPDLASELEGVKKLTFEAAEPVVFEHKSALKKQPLDDANAFETACLNFIEGNGTAVENALLLEYTRTHPAKEKELHQYKKTILTADASVVFPHKEKLYKKSRIVAFYTYARYAAAVILIGLLWNAYSNFQQSNNFAGLYVQHSGVYQESTLTTTNPEQENLIDPVQPQSTHPNTDLLAVAHSVKKEALTNKSEKVESVRNAELEAPTYMKPISTRMKPTTLVFVPNPLRTVRAPQPSQEKQGLFASLLGGKEREKELEDAARTLGNVKVGPSVLNLLGEVSNERLSYTEDNSGDIASLSFKSKLLSFSFPVKQEK